MSNLTNRSRYVVAVKNRDDLTRHFPCDRLSAVEAYMAELRAKGFAPRASQLDESWLVRVRNKGHKPIQETFKSRAEGEEFLEQSAVDRRRGLFVDYTVSRKVTLADLFVRYLLEEAPRHKSRHAYTLEGWLADSGPVGMRLLESYREKLREANQPVRAAKFQMRESSSELAWLHKPLADITTVDVESYINDRLEVVAPAIVDREIVVSARKKVLAQLRAELRPFAGQAAEVVPYLQIFYHFQVATAARRETFSLPWSTSTSRRRRRPETKNGRARKLSLRADLLNALRELPRDTPRVFDVGLDCVVGAWSKACVMAGIEDLHIHDARHEAVSRAAETGRFSTADLKAFTGHRDEQARKREDGRRRPCRRRRAVRSDRARI